MGRIAEASWTCGEFVVKPRPRLFVGSSKEADNKGVLQKLVDILRDELRQIEIVPWTVSPWENLENALKSLRAHLGDYTYAVFLAFPDDRTTIRRKEKYTARDNVIFEFGMFLAQLGVERTFLVAPQEKIPPDHKPFHILTDVGDSFRPGAYTINRLTEKSASVVFRLGGLVKKIKALEAERLKTTPGQAQKALESTTSILAADLQKEGHDDAYYIGKLKESIESLTRHKALAGGKTVASTARDIPLYFKNLPDLCDVRQLAEVQTHKKGLCKVWVFADRPMEFEDGRENDQDFKALRRAILDNLENRVEYVYFVSSNFDTAKIKRFLSLGKNLAPAVCKRVRRNISIVKVEPRLFKTYFTLHFGPNDRIMSIYMSSVMKDRRDLLIQVSDEEHTTRIYNCIRALGKNASDHDGVSLLDLVSA